jgi:rare lipoprotein A
MRRGLRAASGTLVAALFIGSVEAGSAQESPSNSDFQTRFHFQLNPPPGEANTSGNMQDQPTPQTQERPRNPIKELFISPAEAVPAPAAEGPPPAQQPSGTDTAQQPSGTDTAQQPSATDTAQRAADRPLHTRNAADKPLMIGRAAYYEHPGRTASGETYNPDAHTAAHKTLALGTRLRVVNLRNHKSVIVQVTDRSPSKMKFAIDLSRGSANAIGITKREGTALVALYKVD